MQAAKKRNVGFTLFLGLVVFFGATTFLGAENKNTFLDDPNLEKIPLDTALDKNQKIFLGGRVQADYVDLELYGPGQDPTKRYRPWRQYLDLAVYATPLTPIEMLAIFRLENIFGGYWGDQNLYGVRRLTLKGHYPVEFTVGDYTLKLTPLTFQTFSDDLFQADFFLNKSMRNRNEIYLLKDGGRPLTGFQLAYDSDPEGNAGVLLQSNGARLAKQGEMTEYSVYSFDQYFLNASAKVFFQKEFELTGNYLWLFDSPDGGDPAQNPVFRNQIYSLNGKVMVWPDVASFSGEWAQSNTNTHTGYTNYFLDRALNLECKITVQPFHLKVGYRQVGADYIAPGAQTRMLDSTTNLPFLTHNNTWDASSNWFTYPPIVPHFDPQYPLTKYNYRVFTSPKMGFFPYANNIFPYGDATPNRESLQAVLGTDFLWELLQPTLDCISARELADQLGDGIRNFTRLAAALHWHWQAFSGMFGYQREDTRTQHFIGFTSTTAHAGLQVKLSDSLEGLLGYKHIDYNGSEFFGDQFINFSDGLVDQYGIGFKFLVGAVTISCEYQFDQVLDFASGENNFSGNEVTTAISYVF